MNKLINSNNIFWINKVLFKNLITSRGSCTTLYYHTTVPYYLVFTQRVTDEYSCFTISNYHLYLIFCILHEKKNKKIK